jgi:hypothetical protein
MPVTVTAKFVPYEGSATCRIGPIYGGGKCGKRAEVVTVIEGSNGYRYESNPRCREDAIYLLGDVPLVD